MEAVPLAALAMPSTVNPVDLIVNATPLGLHRQKFPALAYGACRPDCVFYELLYGHETDFLRRARAQGRVAMDGAAMLLYQGAAAFTLWTRRSAPLPIMAGALGLGALPRPPLRRAKSKLTTRQLVDSVRVRHGRIMPGDL